MPPRRPNLENVKDHYEVDRTQNRVHVPTDHDRLAQERYNERVDFLRTTGRITQVEAEWWKHHYTVDPDWIPPDEPA